MLQEKKSAQAKTARRDIATLLEQGKLEKAQVKVENSTSASISARACCVFLKIALRADNRCSYQRRCVCRASGASGTLLRAVDRSVWLTRSEVRADSSQETHLSPSIPIRLVVTYALTLLDLKHSGT